MNTFQRAASFSLVSLVTLAISTGIVSAQMHQYQEQHVSNSSSFSYSCEGNGCSGSSADNKYEVKVSQSQSQSVGSPSRYWNRDYFNGKSYRNNDWWSDRDTAGEVEVSWDHRGGTCHVRYTEAGSRTYNYSTSAACDDGSVWIGGLETGRNYRFQVKKDDGSWSRPVTLRAF